MPKYFLVTRYDSLLLVERLLTAKAELGEHLLGGDCERFARSGDRAI